MALKDLKPYRNEHGNPSKSKMAASIRYIDCVSGLLETQYLGLVGGGYL